MDSWIKNATALQDDINRSRKLANEIVREAETGDIKIQSVKHAEDRLQFLASETRYNQQIQSMLCGLRDVRNLLDEAQKLAVEKRILDAVHALAGMLHCVSRGKLLT